jgi:hypothetical protein
MDHETVRINMACAAALMHPPVTIGDLELEAQEYSVMNSRSRSAVGQLGQRSKLRSAAGKVRLLLIAWPCPSDLLF